MKDYKARLNEATAGLHYCDLILTSQEAAELKQLVVELQAAGQHPRLAGVFKSILEDTWSSREGVMDMFNFPKPEQD